MNRFSVFLFSVLTSVVFTIHAQITITSANMPSAGSSFLYSNAALNSITNYTATGPNYTWHFDSLRALSQDMRVFQSAVTTPYSIAFGLTAFGEKTIDTIGIPTIPIPNVPAISITDIYNFYKKTSSMFKTEGLGVKLNGFPVPNYYTDQDELYYFPLTYGSARDSSTFRFSTISTPLIPFLYIKQGYRITEVDGWGSITTPYGTENCLRVVTTQYSIDTLKGTITLPIVGSVPFKFGFPNFVRSYQWLTLSEKIPYLEVSGNLIGSNFNLNQVKYRDITRQLVGIKEGQKNTIAFSVYPNPTNTTLNIITQQSNEDVIAKITDLQGKLLQTQLLKSNSPFSQHALNISNLAQGLYILELTAGQANQSVKFSVQ